MQRPFTFTNPMVWRLCLLFCICMVCTLRANADIYNPTFKVTSDGQLYAQWDFKDSGECKGIGNGRCKPIGGDVTIYGFLKGKQTLAVDAVANFTGAGPWLFTAIVRASSLSPIVGPWSADTYSVSYICSDGSGGTSSTPEPGSIALLGSGILGLAGVLRRKLNV
jgi:hypothetical protein